MYTYKGRPLYGSEQALNNQIEVIWTREKDNLFLPDPTAQRIFNRANEGDFGAKRELLIRLGIIREK